MDGTSDSSCSITRVPCLGMRQCSEAAALEEEGHMQSLMRTQGRRKSARCLGFVFFFFSLLLVMSSYVLAGHLMALPLSPSPPPWLRSMQTPACELRRPEGPPLSSAFLVGWNVIIVTGAATVLLDHEMGPKSKKRQGLAPQGYFDSWSFTSQGDLKTV